MLQTFMNVSLPKKMEWGEQDIRQDCLVFGFCFLLFFLVKPDK